MIKKKKYPSIEPKYLKDKDGKVTDVYLDYAVYESIFDELKDLKKKIQDFKHKTKKAKK